MYVCTVVVFVGKIYRIRPAHAFARFGKFSCQQLDLVTATLNPTQGYYVLQYL